MRKIIVLTFLSLDGVYQAPGGQEEDSANSFKYGGWTAPYGDEVYFSVMQEQMKSSDLLLGRKTFDIFESYWPEHEFNWPGINDVTKYVMSSTRNNSTWNNSVFLNSVEEIRNLKKSDGSNLQVWGSGNLVQTLLANDLVDELCLKIFPLTLGSGKKLFDKGTMPQAFTLEDSISTPSGIIVANYKRAGEVVTGNVG